MKLTAKPRSGPGTARAYRAPTLVPGYVNPNRQKVVARTNAASVSRAGQVVYRLRCGKCDHDYGCNGMDVKSRRCPACDGGTPGEPLPDVDATLPLFG